MNLNLTDSAIRQIEKLCTEHESQFVRLSVEGGGCQGFQYVFGFAQAANGDDTVIGQLVVDQVSQPFLNDATLDFVDDLSGSHFRISNPQASSSCGCGTSFAI
ncbi:MAG TPA: iron-sulfur cluster assembly accessory protein [Alphaproteobacteria bacterium]